MKNFSLILAFSLIISSCSKKKDFFEITGTVNGDYKGYLFLDYNTIRDSVKITDGTFTFKGKVDRVTTASFSTSGISSINLNFYLENTPIKTEITISKKTFNDMDVDWIVVDTIFGTHTAQLQDDFDKFQKKYKNSQYWKVLLYDKLDSLTETYPNHEYLFDLIKQYSYDSELSNKKLAYLYKKFDKKYLTPFDIKHIEYNIYPERRVDVGDFIVDFELPNPSNKIIKTEKYRGSFLLIDFWASWCGPCRKEFPELLAIKKEFEDKNFKILGVSFDRDRYKWLKALDEENLIWENMIDTTDIYGVIGVKYGIIALPSNVLVDKKGIIIAKDLRPNTLKRILEQHIQ